MESMFYSIASVSANYSTPLNSEVMIGKCRLNVTQIYAAQLIKSQQRGVHLYICVLAQG